VLIAIKISFGKSMTPDSAAAAAWTPLRLLPWIIIDNHVLFRKFLEIDCRKEYHFPVPCGPAKPTCFARATYLFKSAALALQNKKRPPFGDPFIPIITYFLSIDSKKIPLFDCTYSADLKLVQTPLSFRLYPFSFDLSPFFFIP
jgi:hypothetical protein